MNAAPEPMRWGEPVEGHHKAPEALGKIFMARDRRGSDAGLSRCSSVPIETKRYAYEQK